MSILNLSFYLPLRVRVRVRVVMILFMPSVIYISINKNQQPNIKAMLLLSVDDIVMENM